MGLTTEKSHRFQAHHGSGTIFFSFCNLRCIFCQNYQISHDGMGQEISLKKLTEIFLELQRRGCHNINLVSPISYIPHIAIAIVDAKKEGLTIPVVYNTNAYESVEALKALDGLIDIYLPDFKYWSPTVAEKLSGVPKEKPYPDFAKEALLEMKQQVGDLVVENKIATKRASRAAPGSSRRTCRIKRNIPMDRPKSRDRNASSASCPSIIRSTRQIPSPCSEGKYGRRSTTWLLIILLREGFKNVFIQETTSAPLFVPDFDEPEPFISQSE